MFSITQYSGFGVSSASNPTPPTPAAPLMSWYDFSDLSSLVVSGGNVTTASDKSTNGFHVTGTASGTRSSGPAYTTNAIGGLSAADFFKDGILAKRQLALLNTALSTATAFSASFVFMTTNAGTSNNRFVFEILDQASLVYARFFDNPSGYGTGTGSYAPGIFQNNIPGPGSVQVQPLLNGGHVGAMAGLGRVGGVFGSATCRYDGTDFGSVGPLNFASTASNLRIGNDNNNEAWAGFVGELRFFAGLLDQTAIEQEEGYLAWKWGLQGNLPIGHPYKNAAP